MDPDQEAKLKAAARAYALSGTAGAGTKRKLGKPPPPPLPSAMHKPTSLSIHRPSLSTTPGNGNIAYHSNLHRPVPPTVTPANNILPHPAPTQFQPLAAAASLPNHSLISESDDDYERFVKSLGLDDTIFASLEDDEDFQLSEDDDDDDEDDDLELDAEKELQHLLDDDKQNTSLDSTPSLSSSPLGGSPMHLPDLGEDHIYKDLEEELGGLLEEDMEASLQSLMTARKPTLSPTSVVTNPTSSSSSSTKNSKASPNTPKASNLKKTNVNGAVDAESPATPLRDAARQGARAQVSYQQSQQLRRLMARHYQLLVQQAVLAVRAAQNQKMNKEKTDFLSGETADDLAEILDGAVGMLQDLDQNRKDAIRESIQLAYTSTIASKKGLVGRRSLLSKFAASGETLPSEEGGETALVHPNDQRLTRAAFSRTLLQQPKGTKRTTFDIPGLVNLKETFSTIDTSVDGNAKGPDNILESPDHAEACRLVLRQAGAHPEESLIPGVKDLLENFTHPDEIFGEDCGGQCNEDQSMFLRRNRNLFSSGEDNLVLRGVNLYGEKQWILIADRYLPDRSVNIISQRYSKICVMLYKASGISIDSKGNLIQPPKLESVDDIDNSKVKELSLTAVDPPAILNVHRWSLEEDLTLLKAVPIMGHMWAELGARLIPHRDRGHLRKRYQVLERRVKATIGRHNKGDPKWLGGNKKIPTSPSSGGKAAAKRPVAANRPTMGKLSPPRKRSSPPMSIEKAAESLTFLRPPRPNPAPAPAPVPVSSVAMKHPGKVIPSIKTIAAKRTPGVAPKRPPSKLPSTTSKLSPVAPINGDQSSFSRAAFEKLVDEAEEDWSQMARMKKMLENDDESLAADAIVSHLAKSPGKSNSKLPQLELDSNSMSGLSILHPDASRQNGAAMHKGVEGTGPSILSNVLEASRKSSGTSGEEKKEKDIGEGKMESPRRRLPKSVPLFATPKRPGSFFSASGTPIGLSPGFRPSPGFSKGITLTPNNPFSPGPATMMGFVDGQSNDDLRFACDFEISDESRKALVQEGGQQHLDPTPPPLTPSKNHSLFDTSHENLDEMTAIDALGALSNSPFRPDKKRSRTEPDDGVDPPKDTKKKKKSLFAAVTGIDGRDPKAKLQF